MRETVSGSYLFDAGVFSDDVATKTGRFVFLFHSKRRSGHGLKPVILSARNAIDTRFNSRADIRARIQDISNWSDNYLETLERAQFPDQTLACDETEVTAVPSAIFDKP